MIPDTSETIVAIATARGAALRGVVRVTGPRALALVEAIAGEALPTKGPRRFAGRTLRVAVGGAERPVPADLWVWPSVRSYTRQPVVEVHTIGSPSVLDAVVRAFVAQGARPAEPGEFTLRAYLAGRIDLVQAAAVLAVIDAETDTRLASALERLAGGLATPLRSLRAELVSLLADLEAGLDFVDEEGIRFVTPDELRDRLAAAHESVTNARDRIATRDSAERAPTAALVGPPNVGKSRLFNALVERFGVAAERPAAIVADEPGVTRDAIAATLVVDGFDFTLVDTPGDGGADAIDAIDAAARARLAALLAAIDLRVECRPAASIGQAGPRDDALCAATMADLTTAATPPGWVATSAATGTGLDTLAAAIARRLRAAAPAADALGFAAERSRAGLDAAADALERSQAAAGYGDELVSFELRAALAALGRVVGDVDAEEVLGEVFARFCIGK